MPERAREGRRAALVEGSGSNVGFAGRHAKPVEQRFHRRVFVPEDVQPVKRTRRSPEEIWSSQVRAADEVDQDGLESTFSDAQIVFRDGNDIEPHVDADVEQLALDFEGDALEHTEARRDQAVEPESATRAP
jgi:hypothetical protein